MQPTLHDGDYLVVLRNGSLLGRFWRNRTASPHGEVILFRAPHDSNSILVKRVIAVGGENVRIRQGEVIVNGMVTYEPYLELTGKERATLDSWPTDLENSGIRAVDVPAHSYFVLGDNRNSSLDSRGFGPIREDELVGVVAFIAHHAQRPK